MISSLFHDFRGAVRGLARRPAFATAAVLTLAVGIGANTAVFSVLYGVVLRPLPFPDAERLVVVWETNQRRGFDRMSVAPPNLRDWRERAGAFDDIGAFAMATDVLPGPDGGELVRVSRVTPELFAVLRVRPVHGRLFHPADVTPAAAPVVILAESFWRSRFRADPGVVGRTVVFTSGSYEIVGIMPAGFRFPPPVAFEAIKTPPTADVFVTLRTDPQTSRAAHFLTAIGRLRATVSLEAAEQDLQRVAAGLAAGHPDTNDGWSVRLVPLIDGIVAEVRPALLVLFAGVALVLLLACANVTHLLLARALDRRRDIAVRVALGASRVELARQLAVEGLTLAAAGAVVGLAFARWGVDLLLATAPAGLPRLADVRLDGWALAFTAGAAVVAAGLASLAPIGHAIRRQRLDGLRARGVSDTRGARRARRGLIGVEAGLAVMLVAASVLVGRSFLRLAGIDPGFQPDAVLMFHTRLSGDAYASDGQRAAFLEQALERLEAVPGVERAGAIDAAPFADDRQGTSFSIEGRPPFPPGEAPPVNFAFASPHYFEALAIPVLEGRAFEPADRGATEPIVIVNETFARGQFPGETAIGRRIALGFSRETVYRRIVGVVGDERHESLASALRGGVYLPALQVPPATLAFFVRTGRDPGGFVTAVRSTIRDIDPTLAVYDAQPLGTVVSESLGIQRFAAGLISVFASVALVLALVGVYGVTSHAVAARRVELGVRSALGASPASLVRTVLVPMLAVAVAGIAAGLAVTASLSQVLTALLVEANPLDPAAYALSAIVVLAATLVATVIPARRAARVDPLQSLRAD